MSGYGQVLGLHEDTCAASLAKNCRNQDDGCLPADGVNAKKSLDSNELVN
jgi:hypothetical protein